MSKFIASVLFAAVSVSTIVSIAPSASAQTQTGCFQDRGKTTVACHTYKNGSLQSTTILRRGQKRKTIVRQTPQAPQPRR